MHVTGALVRPFRSQRGFSLAELLVVSAVLGVMMAGLLVIQNGGTSAYLIGSSRVAAQQNGRVALEMMVRELRSAQSISAVTGSTAITFVDENGVTIRYEYVSWDEDLFRTVAGTSTRLIHSVTSINFTCYSAFNNPIGTITTTTTPGSVVAIRIQLTTGPEVSLASYAQANQHATMESWVRLRNL